MGPCQDHYVVEGHVGGQLCPPEAQIWLDCPELFVEGFEVTSALWPSSHPPQIPVANFKLSGQMTNQETSDARNKMPFENAQ